MKTTKQFYVWITALILMLTASNTLAEEIRVAVASNFAAAIKEIAKQFESNSGHKITLVFGSTGKHYAQIKHGAPFEVFFAADAKRPHLLEQEKIALPGSRFTYAIGKIVLWSPQADLVDKAAQVLNKGKYRYLALANPNLAPYGKAARQVLEKRQLWNPLRNRMVRGENIGQTFQFVKSGNAELGFVAFSQIKRPNNPIEGSYWLAPESLYDPIEQQAVLLKDNAVARAFLDFVKKDVAMAIIRGFGYATP
jgi:molybdate transport system substrate-binding protein